MSAPSRMPQTKRVVIVDDHKVLSELMTRVIDDRSGFKVIGCAKTEAEAVELCTRERPEIVILDLVLPRSSGLVVLDRLRQVTPESRVIVFSGNLTPEGIQRALTAGALGIVGKAVGLPEFEEALEAVAAGRTYFSTEVAEVIKNLVTGGPARAPFVLSELTPREQTVLRYLARGLSSKEIASELGVSVYTVVNHRSRLMKKTGLHRATQLSLFALHTGLLNSPLEPILPDSAHARKP